MNLKLAALADSDIMTTQNVKIDAIISAIVANIIEMSDAKKCNGGCKCGNGILVITYLSTATYKKCPPPEKSDDNSHNSVSNFLN